MMNDSAPKKAGSRVKRRIRAPISGLAPLIIDIRNRWPRRKTMDWFSRTTSIAGIQVPNWILVIVALVVIWIIYSFVAH